MKIEKPKNLYLNKGVPQLLLRLIPPPPGGGDKQGGENNKDPSYCMVPNPLLIPRRGD